MMRSQLHADLSARFPHELVHGLLDAYSTMQRNFAEGRLRPSELEAAHFAEFVFRICQYQCTGSYTPVGQNLPKVNELVKRLESQPEGHDSFKLHIPRVLLGVYEVRNKRGVGHPSGDINPNKADAALVMAVCGWVLAELLRHTYSVPIEQAQAMVDALAERKVPLIQEIEGFPKILRPELPVETKVLLLLYHYAPQPVPRTTISKPLKTVSGSRLKQVLLTLDRAAFIHEVSSGWVLTATGSSKAEAAIARIVTAESDAA